MYLLFAVLLADMTTSSWRRGMKGWQEAQQVKVLPATAQNLGSVLTLVQWRDMEPAYSRSQGSSLL